MPTRQSRHFGRHYERSKRKWLFEAPTSGGIQILLSTHLKRRQNARDQLEGRGSGWLPPAHHRHPPTRLYCLAAKGNVNGNAEESTQKPLFIPHHSHHPPPRLTPLTEARGEGRGQRRRQWQQRDGPNRLRPRRFQAHLLPPNIHWPSPATALTRYRPSLISTRCGSPAVHMLTT
jgi:hypothetical protein